MKNKILVLEIIDSLSSGGAESLLRNFVLESKKNNIIVTPEHPFLTNAGWKKAGELKTGDELMHITMSEIKKMFSHDDNVRGYYAGAGRKDAIEKRLERTRHGDLKDLVTRNRHSKATPTTDEKFVMDVVDEMNLPFAWNGDAKVIIDGNVPDFVCEEEKKCIEVTSLNRRGRKHDTLSTKDEAYLRAGWKCLFIRDMRKYQSTQDNKHPNLKESGDILIWDKPAMRTALRDFISNGIKVLGVETGMFKRSNGSTIHTAYNLSCHPYQTYIAKSCIVHNCAFPDIFVCMTYFVKKFNLLEDTDKIFAEGQTKKQFLHNVLQQLFYSVNQNLREGSESMFTNVSFFDRSYCESLFSTYWNILDINVPLL